MNVDDLSTMITMQIFGVQGMPKIALVSLVSHIKF